jgi:hypothetical protein
MPIYDALEHLIAIAGLNMLLYFLERAKGAATTSRSSSSARSSPRSAPRSGRSRATATNSTKACPARRVRAHVESIRAAYRRVGQGRCRTTPTPSAPSSCASASSGRRQTADDDDDYTGAVRTSWSKACRARPFPARAARRQDPRGLVAGHWAQLAPLARRTRYAPNDRLLKSIVVAIVTTACSSTNSCEAKQRYGMVIGDAEGARLVGREGRPRGAQREPRQPRSAAVGLGLVRGSPTRARLLRIRLVQGGEDAC